MSKKRKSTSDDMPESTRKGRLVEQLVAAMYKYPDCKVRTNIKVPAVDSSFRRYREIDVLIQGGFSGHDLTLAIECKNVNKIIGAPMMGEFIDRLTDVGIPHSSGVYVTARRFTRDAVDRARKAGIKLLTLDGLSPDRLASLLHQAVYSVVVLVPNLIRIVVTLEHNIFQKRILFPCTNSLLFFNKDGIYVSSVSTEAWKLWLKEGSRMIIGTHNRKIDTTGLYARGERGLEKVLSVDLDLGVVGWVADFLGTGTKHSLSTVPASRVERTRTTATFRFSSGTFDLKEFRSELELKQYVRNIPSVAHIKERVLAPRLWHDSLYWPPSDRALESIEERLTLHTLGYCTDLKPNNVTAIEGDNLSTAWEPISNRFFTQDTLIAVR